MSRSGHSSSGATHQLRVYGVHSDHAESPRTQLSLRDISGGGAIYRHGGLVVSGTSGVNVHTSSLPLRQIISGSHGSQQDTYINTNGGSSSNNQNGILFYVATQARPLGQVHAQAQSHANMSRNGYNSNNATDITQIHGFDLNVIQKGM